MNGNQVEITHHGNVALLRVSGVMDESFDRAHAAKLVGATNGPVVIDVGEVHRITSFGVREWMGFIGDISRRSVFLVRARPSFASQFNMIAGFAGNARLITLFAPYACNACDAEFDTAIDLRTAHPQIAALQAPKLPCPKCQSDDTELDDLPEAYFEYIASTAAPDVPAAVSAVIDGKPLKRSALTVRKDVEGELTAIWLSGSAKRTGQLRRVADGLEGEVVVIDHDLQSIGEAAGQALLHILSEESDLRVLARIRPPLLDVIIKSGYTPPIVSLTFEARCDNCNARIQRDFDIDAIADRAGLTAMRCPACATDALGLVAEDMARLDGLPDACVVPASDTVATFLAKNAAPTTGLSKVFDTETPAEERLGRYEVGDKIGTGGMAEVFLGKQVGPEGFEKAVVLKRILPHLADDDNFVQMFLQEARLAARLNDAHVVQIFDLGRDGDAYFMAMEYVDGWDLNQAIRLANRTATKLDPMVVVGIAIRLLSGLQAAHSHVDGTGEPAPIIHRDVSPHNVLIGRNGQVKITDFGVAKAQGTVHTRTGNIKGKVTYMPPEQAQGSSVSVRTDVYAAGLVLFTALAGRNPFRRRSDTESLYAVMRDELPNLSSFRADVPDGIEAIIVKAVEREPSRRFASAAEFRDALEAAAHASGPLPTDTDIGNAMAALEQMARASGLFNDDGPLFRPGHEAILTSETTAVSTPTDENALDDNLALAGAAKTAKDSA